MCKIALSDPKYQSLKKIALGFIKISQKSSKMAYFEQLLPGTNSSILFFFQIVIRKDYFTLIFMLFTQKCNCLGQKNWKNAKSPFSHII